jgi:hypothetical protein
MQKMKFDNFCSKQCKEEALAALDRILMNAYRVNKWLNFVPEEKLRLKENLKCIHVHTLICMGLLFVLGKSHQAEEKIKQWVDP